MPLEYDSAEVSFPDGPAVVSKEDADGNRKYGYIDKTGAVVAPLEYDSADSFSEGLAMVGKKDADRHWKFGYIDKTGAVVVPLEHPRAHSFSEALAAVTQWDADFNTLP